MDESQNRTESKAEFIKAVSGFFKEHWKRLLLGLVALLVLILVGLCVWVSMPVRNIPVTELLPSKPFTFFTLTLDKRDPAVRQIVSRLKDRLGTGHGFARKSLVNLLLPAALPDSLVVVAASDAGSGEPQILVYASMGRFSRVLRLFAGPACKVLLRGGPIVKERIARQTLRSLPDAKASLSPSAYAIIGNTLVLGTSRAAVLDCSTTYMTMRQGNDARSAFSATLQRAREGHDPALYVDNSTGGMSRLVNKASEKYAFAAFPTIDAVSLVTGSFKILPDSIGGTLVFSSSSLAQVEGIRSDVKFIYGAAKRVARAAGLNMKGEVDVKENEVLLNFQIPDYLGAPSAPATNK
jgi:hypothetical protein